MTYFGNYQQHAPLQPHIPESKIELLGGVISQVKVSQLALDKMNKYIQFCDEEIGWLGVVREQTTSFLIEDVILFDQEVSAVTTRIDEISLAKIYCKIMADDPINGVDTANAIRMWGHSHVNMSVGPSGQDDSQMVEFQNSKFPYFIRAIGNKQGKMRFDIFHFALGYVIQDAKWSIQIVSDDSLDAQIRAEIQQRITKKVWSQPSHGDFFKNLSNRSRHVSRGLFVDEEEELDEYLKAVGRVKAIKEDDDWYGDWLESYGKDNGYGS